MKHRQTATKQPRHLASEMHPLQPAPPASEPSTVATNADAAARYEQIAREAYLLAERRGFSPGAELDDWLAAEAIVAERLRTGANIRQQEQRVPSHH